MNKFFQSIESIVDKVELQFNIKSKDGKLTVMVMPKSTIKDSAGSNIKPLFITGTAEELDKDFLEAITRPLESAAGIVHNIATFEAGADKLAKESDVAKKQKEQEKKDTEAKNKKYAALMGKADSFESEKKYKEAIGAIKQAKEFTDKTAVLDKRIADLMSKLSQGSIFDQQAASEEDKTDYLADYKEEPASSTEEADVESTEEEEIQEDQE